MNVDITLVLGAFAGMLIGFYGIARVILNQAAKDRDSDRIERQELATAIKEMAGASGRQADASTKVAEATVQSAKEAEIRNGHLGEQNVHIANLAAESNQMTKEILTSLLSSAKIDQEDRCILTSSSRTQHIDQQNVGNQIIKEVKKK